MTDAEIHDFLVKGHTLQVATIGKDGFPHVAPMWYVVEGHTIVFRSFTKSQKIVNLRRNPKVTVLVERGTTYAELQGVMLKAEARLVEDPAYVLRIYGRLAAKYAMAADTPVEPSPEVIEAMYGRYAAKNTVVEIEPHEVISWDHTKLGNAY